MVPVLPEQQRLVDIATAFRAGRSPSALALATAILIRDMPAIVRWIRTLPVVQLTLSDNAAGNDIVEALLNGHSYWSRRRAVAVLRLPDTFEEYLRGRSRQAVRTNRRRALELGLSVVRADSPGQASTMLTSIAPSLPDHMVAGFARHIAEGTDEVWFVLDGADCVAAASLTIDESVARINRLQVSHDFTHRSAARYLLSSELIGRLIELRRRYLVSDSMLFASQGIIYLHERLGLHVANIEIRRFAAAT